MSGKATVPEVGPDTEGRSRGSSPGSGQDIDFGVHGGLLDTAEAYQGQLVVTPEESMFGAQSRQGWTPTPQDIISRGVRMNLGAQTDARAKDNREYLYELSEIVGHEGEDFQNPYAWTAPGVLQIPNAESGLAQGIGGVRLGQTPDEVALNVAHSANIMQV